MIITKSIARDLSITPAKDILLKYMLALKPAAC